MYTKLFSSITDSTIWREPDHTRIVWITMLAMADKYGVVQASVPGLADRARVSLDGTVKALEILEAPDEWSRSQEHEGRRIEEIAGGWRLLNYTKYRKIRDEEERKEYMRNYMRKRRCKTTVNNVSNVNSSKPPLANVLAQDRVQSTESRVVEGSKEENTQKEEKGLTLGNSDLLKSKSRPPGDKARREKERRAKLTDLVQRGLRDYEQDPREPWETS